MKDEQIHLEDRICFFLSQIPYFGLRIVEWYYVRKITKQIMPYTIIGVVNKVAHSVFNSDKPLQEERE